jgi:hypothetical protein
MTLPLRDDLPHPMQPVGLDADGIARFKANAIVRFLLEKSPTNIQELSCIPWPDGDFTHLMQLLGYSVSGYGDLSTSPASIVAAADAVVDDEVRSQGGDLTFAELLLACANVGVDLNCGACASIFYTGATEHPHTCEGGQ